MVAILVVLTKAHALGTARRSATCVPWTSRANGAESRARGALRHETAVRARGTSERRSTLCAPRTRSWASPASHGPTRPHVAGHGTPLARWFTPTPESTLEGAPCNVRTVQEARVLDRSRRVRAAARPRVFVEARRGAALAARARARARAVETASARRPRAVDPRRAKARRRVAVPRRSERLRARGAARRADPRRNRAVVSSATPIATTTATNATHAAAAAASAWRRAGATRTTIATASAATRDADRVRAERRHPTTRRNGRRRPRLRPFRFREWSADQLPLLSLASAASCAVRTSRSSSGGGSSAFMPRLAIHSSRVHPAPW